MSETLYRVQPPNTKPYYSRPDPDMTDEEIDAWAGRFVDAVLGPIDEPDSEPG